MLEKNIKEMEIERVEILKIESEKWKVKMKPLVSYQTTQPLAVTVKKEII